MYLEDLKENGGRLLYFAAEGEPNFPSVGGKKGPNRIHWAKGDDPISYTFAGGRPRGSPAMRIWLRKQAHEVGPQNLVP